MIAGFAGTALAAAVLMLVLREPMRVAVALVAAMLSLAGIYALLGVHAIAVFQVLIYVGAVMVFMVYAIMLLDVRDRGHAERYSALLVPGIAGLLALVAVLMHALRGSTGAGLVATDAFALQPFAELFLRDYLLHFELVSLLLVAAVVAALAVVRVGGRRRG